MKTVWSESMQEMNHALGGGDNAYGLNEAKQLLQTLEKQKQQAQEMGSSTLPEITLEKISAAKEAEREQEAAARKQRELSL